MVVMWMGNVVGVPVGNTHNLTLRDLEFFTEEAEPGQVLSTHHDPPVTSILW